jgi:hypothetical protein
MFFLMSEVPVGGLLQALPDRGEQGALLIVAGVVQHGRVLLGLGAEDHQQRGVAAIVEDHVGRAAVVPFEDAVGVLPVLLQRLALVGEHRRAVGSDGRGRVILGGVDVAGGPADLGAQGLQRLDQHRRLDGHVQAAGDAGALQRLFLRELLAHGHETGHFSLGDGDLLASEVGQVDVGDHVVALARVHHSIHGEISMVVG